MIEPCRIHITAVPLDGAWKLRMDFASWIGRMQTPPDRTAVIRSLLLGAAAEVRAHFEVEADGSFTIDAVLLEATRLDR